MPEQPIVINSIDFVDQEGITQSNITLTPDQAKILCQVGLSVLVEMGLVNFIRKAQQDYAAILEQLNPEDLPQA